MQNSHTSSKISLFLGAGSSVFAGYRTFQTFPELMFKNKLREQEGLNALDEDTKKLLKNIGMFLNNIDRPQTHDNFMWVLDRYNNLSENFRLDSELKSRFISNTVQQSDFGIFDSIVRNAKLEMIRTTVNHYSRNSVSLAKASHKNLYNTMKTVTEFYLKLAKINNQHDLFLPIFTTNYDLLLEDMFDEFKLELTDNKYLLVNGFYGSPKDEEHWDFECYDCPDFKQKYIHLYRIHGCASWFWHGFGDPKIYFNRASMLKETFEKVCAMFPGNEIYKGNNPHHCGFMKFFEILQRTSLLIFIGFSFRDDDVIHLTLSANYYRKKPLNILVVDPDLKHQSVVSRLEDAARRNQFPSKIPDHNNISILDIAFGESQNFEDKIIETINHILEGEKHGNC